MRSVDRNVVMRLMTDYMKGAFVVVMHEYFNSFKMHSINKVTM